MAISSFMLRSKSSGVLSLGKFAGHSACSLHTEYNGSSLVVRLAVFGCKSCFDGAVTSHFVIDKNLWGLISRRCPILIYNLRFKKETALEKEEDREAKHKFAFYTWPKILLLQHLGWPLTVFSGVQVNV